MVVRYVHDDDVMVTVTAEQQQETMITTTSSNTVAPLLLCFCLKKQFQIHSKDAVLAILLSSMQQ